MHLNNINFPEKRIFQIWKLNHQKFSVVIHTVNLSQQIHVMFILTQPTHTLNSFAFHQMLIYINFPNLNNASHENENLKKLNFKFRVQISTRKIFFDKSNYASFQLVFDMKLIQFV